jgi:hypothetical protein
VRRTRGPARTWSRTIVTCRSTLPLDHVVNYTQSRRSIPQSARVTHRFHPLFGQDFEFVVHRQNWGEDRVHMRDENGQPFSVPAGWTDVAPVDPFVVIAAGRCRFTTSDLLAVAEVIDRLRSQPDRVHPVRKITP